MGTCAIWVCDPLDRVRTYVRRVRTYACAHAPFDRAGHGRARLICSSEQDAHARPTHLIRQLVQVLSCMCAFVDLCAFVSVYVRSCWQKLLRSLPTAAALGRPCPTLCRASAHTGLAFVAQALLPKARARPAFYAFIVEVVELVFVLEHGMLP